MLDAVLRRFRPVFAHVRQFEGQQGREEGVGKGVVVPVFVIVGQHPRAAPAQHAAERLPVEGIVVCDALADFFFDQRQGIETDIQVDLIPCQHGHVRANGFASALIQRLVGGRGPAAVPMVVEATPEPDREGVPALLGYARGQRAKRTGAKPLPATLDSGPGIRLDATLERQAIVAPGFESSKRHDGEEALLHPRKRTLPLADASCFDFAVLPEEPDARAFGHFQGGKQRAHPHFHGMPADAMDNQRPLGG